jgi:hypothetical protein
VRCGYQDMDQTPTWTGQVGIGILRVLVDKNFSQGWAHSSAVRAGGS